MTKRQKDILLELYSLTNKMGSNYASILTVSKDRIIAYQEANMTVSKIILKVVLDTKENEEREYDYEEALEMIEELKEIANKDY